MVAQDLQIIEPPRKPRCVLWGWFRHRRRIFPPIATRVQVGSERNDGLWVYSAGRVPRTPSKVPQTPLPKERIDAAVSTQLEQIWSQVQGKLAAAVDESTYPVWLEPLPAT